MKTPTFTFDPDYNILKVADISYNEVSDKCRSYLEYRHVTYSDTKLNEDLINIEDAIEDEELPEEIKPEVEALKELATKYECGYIRFIKI